jgi:hypothetical protein
VLPSSAALLAANYSRLAQVAQEICSFAADVAVAGQDESSEEPPAAVPGWSKVAAVVQRAAQQAQQYQQELDQLQQQQQGQQQAGLQQQQEFDSAYEEVVKQLLLWAQTASKSSSSTTTAGSAAANGTTQQPDTELSGQEAASEEQPAIPVACSIPEAAGQLQEQLQPARLAAVAAATGQLLEAMAGSDVAQQAQQARQLAQLQALLWLLRGAVLQQACRYCLLHKSCAKLGLVTSSVFCSLVLEGYCVPEGQEVEGGGRGRHESGQRMCCGQA